MPNFHNQKMKDELDELFIYLLVRTDLKMSKGKVAAQCGHAIQELILNPLCPKSILKDYLDGDHAKVCLKVVNLEELESFRNLCQKNGFLHHLVIDAGRTQVPANSATVLGIGPISKGDAQPILGTLKLL